MEKELICIVCPKGCRIKVENIDNSFVVMGNSCKMGEKYAIKEITNPMRVLTSTVIVRNSNTKRLPVKTKGEIPKEMIFKCMEVINEVEVYSPIKIGQVIIENILNTGVNVVACKSVK